MRSDHGSVKYLFAHAGAEGVRRWHQAPFVDLDTARLPLPDNPVEKVGTPEMPLPWEAFVAGFSINDVDERARYFCFHVSQKFPTGIYQHNTGSILAEIDAIYHISVPFLLGVASSAVFLKDGKTKIRMVMPESMLLSETDKEDISALLTEAHKVTFRLVNYLHQSPKHMTEVTPANPHTTPKTAKLKPWVRDDLPRIILLDPTTAARTYGMPTGTTITERHAPIPHGRRGHWRRLDDERRTWVRPCWIGPTSWESKGQIYRVLVPPDKT